MSSRELAIDAELEKLQRETFGYFLHETNPANGLSSQVTPTGPYIASGPGWADFGGGCFAAESHKGDLRE